MLFRSIGLCSDLNAADLGTESGIRGYRKRGCSQRQGRQSKPAKISSGVHLVSFLLQAAPGNPPRRTRADERQRAETPLPSSPWNRPVGKRLLASIVEGLHGQPRSVARSRMLSGALRPNCCDFESVEHKTTSPALAGSRNWASVSSDV